MEMIIFGRSECKYFMLAGKGNFLVLPEILQQALLFSSPSVAIFKDGHWLDFLFCV